MEKETYFKIFNRYFKGGVNIDGIIFTLNDIIEPDGDNGLINEELYFTMSNPLDLSYNVKSLQTLIIDNLQNFNNVFSLGYYGLNGVEIVNSKEIHIGRGDDVRKLISDVLKNKTKLVSNKYDGNLCDVFIVEPFNFSCTLYGEFIRIINNVTPISAYVLNMSNGKKVNEIEIDAGIELVYQEGFSGLYDETELNYSEIDEVPFPVRFLDNEYQASFVETSFNIKFTF